MGQRMRVCFQKPRKIEEAKHLPIDLCLQEWCDGPKQLIERVQKKKLKNKSYQTKGGKASF